MGKIQEFIEAVKGDDRATVASLLEIEPDLVNTKTEDGLSMVLTAAYYGHLDLARWLAVHSTRLDIFEAATVGDLDRVKNYVNEDPSQINAFSLDGFPLLGLASFFGNYSVVDFLVNKGAEVNAASRNPQRVTPLHSAAAHQHLEIARLLLENGADPNARQINDFVPLQAAAQNGQVEMAQLLLDFGADVNARSSAGKSALGIALENQHAETAEFLRARGGIE